MTTHKTVAANHAALARDEEDGAAEGADREVTLADVEAMLATFGAGHYLRIGPAVSLGPDGRHGYVATVMRVNDGKWSTRAEGRERALVDAVQLALKNASSMGSNRKRTP